jgi:hypothetical protein
MLPMIYCNETNRIVYPAPMGKAPASWARLDRVAIGLSSLCVVHCCATAILLGLLASAGGFLGQPVVHEVGLGLAMVLGAIALGRGQREHGFILPAAVGMTGLAVMGYALTLHETGLEPIFTVAGVMVLALGHRLNVMAAEHSF